MQCIGGAGVLIEDLTADEFGAPQIASSKAVIRLLQGKRGGRIGHIKQTISSPIGSIYAGEWKWRRSYAHSTRGSAPLLPHVSIRLFNIAGKLLGIHQGRSAHSLTQRGAKLSQAGQIACQSHGNANILTWRLSNELRK